jgi:Carboxypeptidase regulatory-like domain/TonB dependent receptor
MKRRWQRALGLCCVLLLSSAPLGAQTYFASFTGTTVSSDGQPVADAEVVATNVQTQVTYTAKSNSEGLYTITSLPIGTYKIRAQAQGFQAYETNEIPLESGQNARVDIRLQVGGFGEVVEVTGVTPILQTQDAVVGEVVSETTIRNMPLNGRNFSQLSLLLPGAISTDPNSFTQPKNFGSGRPNVNGQREQSNNYTLDGIDMNEPIDNLLPYQPSPDALAEVRVETNNYSAEYGNVAGAVIGSTIKSGTNEFHGVAFEYWRDNSMSANTWENNRARGEKADLSQHIFGATIGGPIAQNKVFFFADYQGFLRDRPGELVTTVAPLAWRQGDFSGVAGVTIRDPDTGQPFQGNRIPQSRFSPIATALLANPSLYPEPNRAGDNNNLVAGSSDKQRTHQTDAKVDVNMSENDRFFGRFSYQYYKSEPERAPLESQLVTVTDSPFLGLAFNWNRTLSPTMVNEALVGFSHVEFEELPTDWAGIGNANATIGIPGGQTIPGLSRLVFTGAGEAGSAANTQFNNIKTYQFTEKFSWFKGRHALKFGGRWLYQRQGFSYSGNEGSLGHFDYSGSFTGFGFADFLLDKVSAKGLGGLVEPFTQLAHRVGIFAQDDFRVNNDLTLNLGLTWEYLSPWVEKDDRQSNIDLTTGQLVLAGRGGASRALYDAFYGGWEPRVGAAWSPTENWVVRGAFGIVQYMEGTGKNLRLTQNPPFNFEGRGVFDATTGAGSAAVGFADITPNTSGGPGTLYRVFAPDLRPQFTKQWNVFVERQLTPVISAQMGYVGSRSSHMVVPFDFNQPEPDPGPVQTWRPLDQRRPLYPLNPDIGQTSGTNSIGIGAYDALQTSVRQRYNEGLEFLASYTYGKALSDNVGYYGTGWGQTGAQGYYYLDSSDPRRDYGRSTYDARHSFSLAGTYELPFGRGRKMKSDLSPLADAFLGGWNVHAIYQARTGFAFTVIDGAGQSLQATRSVERPDRLCDGSTDASGPNDVWIDLSCFAHAPAGQFGTAGHNILSGPGYWNLDFALSKNIHIDDRRFITFKIEAFNALNHPNWGAPSSDLADPTTFGRINNTFSAPRIIELVGKFTY